MPRALQISGVLLALGAAPASAEVATLAPAADTTIYSEGDLSNGGGQHLFAGTTIPPADARRALLRFDPAAALPAGAVVLSAELRLVVDRTIVGPVSVGVHRVLASWGEGVVEAPGREGMGAPADPGDATWGDRAFPATLWATPGGDFVPAASATAVADQDGPVTWSSAALAADVQAWLDDPSSAFGWIVIADESLAPSAKRFASREALDPEDAPRLVVEWEPAPIPTLGAAASWLWAGVLAVAGCWAIARRR